MIIVEGFDNTGKTTLVKRLESTLGCTAKKSPGPKDTGILFAWVQIQLRDSYNRNILYDRFPVISDSVYGKHLRNRDPFRNTEDGRVLVEKVISRDPLIIWCDPGMGIALDFGEREQMKGVADKAKTLYLEYQEIMHKLSAMGASIIKYNYNAPMADVKLATSLSIYLSNWFRKKSRESTTIIYDERGNDNG